MTATVTMSIAFYCLLAEIGIVILLLVPFISTAAWSRLFSSNLLKWLSKHISMGFYIMIFLLVIVFADAMRVEYDQRRAKLEAGSAPNTHVEEHINMRLFRAQRDSYIAGFALFLIFVISRLIRMVSDNARLEASLTALSRQAQGAASAAASATTAAATASSSGAADEGTVKALKTELEQKKKDLTKALSDLEGMRRQSENLSAEYDRVAEECATLQRREKMASGSGGKKDK